MFVFDGSFSFVDSISLIKFVLLRIKFLICFILKEKSFPSLFFQKLLGIIYLLIIFISFSDIFSYETFIFFSSISKNFY